MNYKIVQEIAERGKREHWPYPRIFDALKDAGAESYDVEVSHHRIVHRGGGSQWVEPVPTGWTTLPIADRYDESALNLALRRVQEKKTDYLQFLREIADAGIRSYRVDMKSRTVTYSGRPGEEHVENVPPSMAAI